MRSYIYLWVNSRLKGTLENNLDCLCRKRRANRITTDAREIIKVALGASTVSIRGKTISWKREAISKHYHIRSTVGALWSLVGALCHLYRLTLIVLFRAVRGFSHSCLACPWYPYDCPYGSSGRLYKLKAELRPSKWTALRSLFFEGILRVFSRFI